MKRKREGNDTPNAPKIQKPNDGLYEDKAIKVEDNPGDLRGKRVLYPPSELIESLDSLARVFSKTPYTAILKPKGVEDLYISFPERNEQDMHNGMDKTGIEKLQFCLNKLVAHPDSIDKKTELFTLACDLKNSFALAIVTEGLDDLRSAWNNHKINNKKDYDEQWDILEDLKDRNDNYHYFMENSSYDDSFTCKVFRELVKNKFDGFLSPKELKSLHQFSETKFIKVPFYYGDQQDEDYRGGVHVEAKGVHYLSLKYPKITEITVGLANAKLQTPGCCGSCTLEFKLLETREEHPIIVHRVADFPDSRPDQTYRPSPFFKARDPNFARKELMVGNVFFLENQLQKHKDQSTKLREQVLEQEKLSAKLKQEMVFIQKKTELEVSHNKTLANIATIHANYICKLTVDHTTKIQKLNTELESVKQQITAQETKRNSLPSLYSQIKLMVAESKEGAEKIDAQQEEAAKLINVVINELTTKGEDLRTQILEADKQFKTTEKDKSDEHEKTKEDLTLKFKDTLETLEKEQETLLSNLKVAPEIEAPEISDQPTVLEVPNPNQVIAATNLQAPATAKSLTDSHYKRTEKSILSSFMAMEEIENKQQYDLSKNFVALNGNLGLLNRLIIESTVEVGINIKSIASKDKFDENKTGKVSIIAEHDHEREHTGNVQFLINEINSRKIEQNTVIAIERKQYGEHQGMKDVIILANILVHNEKTPSDKIRIPEEIEKAPMYQDALLYKIALQHGVKVIGIEGKNLEHDKDSSFYNQAREGYMSKVINLICSKGYNVIACVGAAHVKGITHAVNDENGASNPIKVSWFRGEHELALQHQLKALEVEGKLLPLLGTLDSGQNDGCYYT